MSSYAQHRDYDPLLSVKESADYVNMHAETLKRLANLKEIACVRNLKAKGSNIKFRLSVLNKWIKDHTVAASRVQS